MPSLSTRRRPLFRLFATYGLVSLLPVLLLGLVLAASYRSVATQRGLAEGRSEGLFVAWTAVDPFLGNRPLADGLSAATHAALVRTVDGAVDKHEVLQVQLLALNGRAVFASAGSPRVLPPLGGAASEASWGAVAATLHPLRAAPASAANPETVEVDVPLSGSASKPIGMLRIVLPYAPIAADVASGLHSLYGDLVFGLGALYLVLFLLSLSVSRRLRQQVRLNRHQAEHDPLTGLPNRARFHRKAELAVGRARRHDREAAIAVIDLDRFKDVNDTLGHHNGDRVLVELARRLAAFVRPQDVVARLGGDEFGVILDGIEEPEAVLTQMRAVIEREFELDGLPLSIEASVGYVVSPADGVDVDELLQRADIAMYVAKASHAEVVAYHDEQNHYDPARLSLIAELRHAIDAGQLTLHYQPKMTLSDGSTGSVEALVRWNHPVLGLLYPDRFLPLAEQTDLMDRLTDWVLSTALNELSDLGPAGSHLSLAVNVSARNLACDDFAERVVDALELAGVESHRLTVEITETALLTDPLRAAAVLHALDREGVKVSLDDFGKGQTSLGYLSSLPVRELKIDQGFVTDMLSCPSHAAIVRSIVDLGHNLALEVVGEGVESGEVLRALRDSGCNTAQGFLLGRPMPVEELARWLSAAALRERVSA
ncbi:MAG TPA: EAL domain-containing protein [Acidimicrobiales bacterium]|nr:EAL domain-containing protein [Acidimicrobiales bacterium]